MKPSFISPNIPTHSSHLGGVTDPSAAIICGQPTLKKTAVPHKVHVPEGAASVRRLACLRLALDTDASKKLIAFAKANQQYHTSPPWTEAPRGETPATEGLARIGTTFVIPSNGENDLYPVPLDVHLEKMNFPGTNGALDTFVLEMYEVSSKPVEKASAQADSFFSKTAQFFSNTSEVVLQEPRHIGTVGAFRFGRDGRYVLYRQLQENQSDPSAFRNRRLLVEAHGSELAPGSVPAHVNVPETYSLPHGITMSDMVPSGALTSSGNKPEEEKTVNKRAAQFFSTFAKGGADEPPVPLRNVSYMKKNWPMYSSQRLTGSNHQIDFMGAHITSDKQAAQAVRLTSAQMFQKAAAGHGQLRNQLLGSSEQVCKDNVNPPGKWRNDEQRAVVTADGLAFAAMDMPGVMKTDILAIMPGMNGTSADMLNEMRKLGILGQYDHIGSDACKAIHGSSSHEEWHIDRNLPQESPTTVVSQGEGTVPVLTQIHPRHASQIIEK